MPITIDIELKNYRCFEDSAPAKFRVRPGFTAFIGKNNSGKSTLLRFLYEFRGLFQALPDPNVLKSAEVRHAFNPPSNQPNPESWFCDTNSRDLTIGLRGSNPEWGKQDLVPQMTIVVYRDTNSFSLRFRRANGDSVSGVLEIVENKDLIKAAIGGAFGRVSYVRDMATALSDTLYIPAFRNAINIGANENFYDIPVGQAFIRTWKHMQAGSVKKSSEATHRLKHEIRRIFQFEELEILPSADEKTLQLMVNGKSYPLLEVGSGFAHFVMVLAAAATRRPKFILIDEPELSLHASLQADFLETLAAYADGVIFATHSLGLARVTADAIYSVVREGATDAHGPRSRVQLYEQTPHLAGFAEALSFGNTPELGFSQIVLVEGPTDARAIQQLLRGVGKEHEVLLIPLGGSSLIKRSDDVEAQLLELKRITPKVQALIDSEQTGADQPLDSDRQGFQDACEMAGIRCQILERRALENYFPIKAIEAGIGPGRQALGPFDKLGDARPGWQKSQNWKIAREMRPEDLDGTDLGEFIKRL
jgi:energy-coupling factor transporter ATP-binding protein EcfA2